MPTRKANRDVINQYIRDGAACPDLNGYGSVSVRNGNLYSYRALIGEWTTGDRTDTPTLVIHAGWDGYSPTTSKHMKYLYDAVTGNSGAYAYRRDDFSHDAGYDEDTPVVPLQIIWDGSGKRKARWRQLKDSETDQ
jgi:hypothetical protein